MKITFTTVTLLLLFFVSGKAQTKVDQPAEARAWTEADRKYLLDNLIRSKKELLSETKNLSKTQWNFKETSDRWSINQIVEHIALWELLFMHEISRALATEPNATFSAAPDSLFLDQDTKDLKKNNALDYTKPFSFAIPLGNNKGKNNVVWLTTMRDESIDYLKNESKNIRLQYDYCAGANVHQYYMMIFSHTFRHLRQIKKVKAHPKFPKK
jgi:hypothetical protein